VLVVDTVLEAAEGTVVSGGLVHADTLPRSPLASGT
jgi:hypothetical protein